MNFLIEFDYLAEEDDELNLQKGDIVNDVKPYEDGWMIGTFKGKKGVFPSNFGKQIPAENNKIQSVKSNSGSVSNDAEEEIHKENILEEPKTQAKKVMGVGFGDIFSGKQIQLKHTAVSESKNQSNEDDSKPEMHFEKRIGFGSGYKVELVKAIYSYNAENIDELEIEEGDIITVIDKKNTDEGWWKGKLNNKVGVFPNNFVVAISAEEANVEDKVDGGKLRPKHDQASKPARPVAAKNPPPLPLTAKPITSKPKITSVPVRPPTTPEPVKLTSKSSAMKIEPEIDDVGFETPFNHKPLVGPTAERVRRQNIRPPKKSLEVSNSNDDKPIVTADISKTAQFTTSKSSISKDKVTDNISPDSKYATTTSKTSSIKDKYSDNPSLESISKHVSARERSKDFVDSVDASRKIKSEPDKTKESSPAPNVEVPDTKVNYRPKSQLYGGSYQMDSDLGKTLKMDDSEIMRKRILVLESKVSAVEEENISLRDEMTALRKTSNDQSVTMMNIVNKLLADFDLEVEKRKSIDLKLTHLKEIVDDL